MTAALHVLVADDYPDVAQLVVELLTEISPVPFTSDVGFNGVDAVRLAIAHPPQLVVLDIDMPLLNGIDAALAIRAALAPRPPLLVAMTGRMGQASLAQEQSAFDRVLQKPLNLDALQSIVAGVCEHMGCAGA